MFTPTVESIMWNLLFGLRDRKGGHRQLGMGFPFYDEESETLRMVDLALFALEDSQNLDELVVAYQATVRVKPLSDPTPERRTLREWRIGKMEDVAKAIMADLQPPPVVQTCPACGCREDCCICAATGVIDGA